MRRQELLTVKPGKEEKRDRKQSGHKIVLTLEAKRFQKKEQVSIGELGE
jgi:hypothetical protein